ncbi:hypothetical protein JNM87_06430 [Candidatus Saccharibacteria bacterium]|nr:hypothetical protein [Candidatus Saccharibacteria bacterium]
MHTGVLLEYRNTPNPGEQGEAYPYISICGKVNAEWYDDTVRLHHPSVKDYHGNIEDCILAIYAESAGAMQKISPVFDRYYSDRSFDDEYGTDVEFTVPTITGLEKLRNELTSEEVQPVHFMVCNSHDLLTPKQYLWCIANTGCFPLSSGLDAYLHDVTDHTLGALIIPKFSWNIFRRLAADALSVEMAKGAPGKEYRDVLVGAMDNYTERAMLSSTDAAEPRDSLLQSVDKIVTNRKFHVGF